MSNESPEIQWYDIANLLYGDLVVEEEALLKLAQRLEDIRNEICSTIIPQINDVSDAKLVYSQLAYKIAVMENELKQFKIGSKSSYAPKQLLTYNPTNEKDILIALKEQIARFKTVKAELEMYNNRLEDSEALSTVNAQLNELFG